MVIFAEDFENAVARTPLALTSYTGASGATYTALPQWLNQYACNGTVTSYNSSPEPKCAGRPSGGVGQEAELRRQAYALGLIAGSSDPANEHRLSEYTQQAPDYPPSGGDPPLNSVEFQSSQLPITLANRFVAFN